MEEKCFEECAIADGRENDEEENDFAFYYLGLEDDKYSKVSMRKEMMNKCAKVLQIFNPCKEKKGFFTKLKLSLVLGIRSETIYQIINFPLNIHTYPLLFPSQV